MSKGPTTLVADNPASALARANAFHLVQGGNSRGATAGQIADFARDLPTRATIATTTIDSSISVLSTSGYTTAGDGGGGLYVRTGSEPAHEGKVQSVDGAWWELASEHNGVRVEQFGAVGDGSTDCSTAITNAIAYCIEKSVGSMFFGAGTFRCNSQISVTAGAGTSLRLNLFGHGVFSTIIDLRVTGSVASYDSAGFGMVFDGWRESQISGMRIDFTNGTAGVLVRCRNQSSNYNQFGHSLEIRGGAVTADRETSTKIALRLTGNESTANATTYTTYYNTVLSSRLTTAYRTYHHLVGDGAAGTQQPNGNHLIGCNIDRYVIGVDFGDTDENTVSNSFWNTAAGVVGENGGFTHCVDISGSLNRIVGCGMEPGTSSKPWRLASTASNNVIDIASNCTDNGDYNATVQSNRIFDRQSLRGVDDVNNVNTDSNNVADVNLFGDGTNSHAGTGFQSLNVWARSLNTKRLAIGYTASTTGKINVPAGDTIELEAGASGTILLDADTFETDAATIKLSGATTQSTVGSAGGASALPATPTGYLVVSIGGTNFAIPYFAAS